MKGLHPAVERVLLGFDIEEMAALFGVSRADIIADIKKIDDVESLYPLLDASLLKEAASKKKKAAKKAARK